MHTSPYACIPPPPLHASPPLHRPPLNPYDDEYEFSLTQYMVTLDKPIGVTLAPDPLTGQVRENE